MPMQAPKSGVTVRMYRQGHGDCFLLAFPPEEGADPVYVLIDCGYKPGSQTSLSHGMSIKGVVDHLREETGGRIDLAVITHEHQDHCNGIWKSRDPYFDPFDIKEAWFAWTESPTDALAKKLRQQHRDQLLSLVQARDQLGAMGAAKIRLRSMDSLLAFELGGDEEFQFGPDALGVVKDPETSVNKQALKLIKDKASAHLGVRYLSPGGAPLKLPRSGGVKVYVLGPPRSSALLGDEDPQAEEEFSRNGSGAHNFSFSVAAHGLGEGTVQSPFRREYQVSKQEAANGGTFFDRHYGSGAIVSESSKADAEAADNAEWRRIDNDWLLSAEEFALKLNTGINNTSLVLAFELPNTGKVLLFAADAQRGNWISWHKCKWDDGATARDLLARTVLYKVGHHGSHNATLNGDLDSEHANLSWMGIEFPDEFAAMITAVNKWATKNDPPWHHPLESIRKALHLKTEGRVFQTDQDELHEARGVSKAAWRRFRDRVHISDLYFDYTIFD